jgi:hypothetical protein
MVRNSVASLSASAARHRAEGCSTECDESGTRSLLRGERELQKSKINFTNHAISEAQSSKRWLHSVIWAQDSRLAERRSRCTNE